MRKENINTFILSRYDLKPQFNSIENKSIELCHLNFNNLIFSKMELVVFSDMGFYKVLSSRYF